MFCCSLITSKAYQPQSLFSFFQNTSCILCIIVRLSLVDVYSRVLRCRSFYVPFFFCSAVLSLDFSSALTFPYWTMGFSLLYLLSHSPSSLAYYPSIHPSTVKHEASCIIHQLIAQLLIIFSCLSPHPIPPSESITFHPLSVYFVRFMSLVFYFLTLSLEW